MDIKSPNGLSKNAQTIELDNQTSSSSSVPITSESHGDHKYRPREQWSNKFEFIFSCMAFSIGLGNIWRFPYLCFKNGGGAFFIPYTVCLFGGGIPIYFLEVAIGQYFQSGGITVWNRICPLLKGIGYGTIVICFILNIYYIVILAWTLIYLSYSFHQILPWSTCGNPWNTPNCWLHGMNRTNTSVDSVVEFWEREILQISEGIDHPNGFQWWLVGALFIMWVVCFFCIWRGIKSTGKSAYITSLFPYVTLIILIVRGITLPGASKGIKFYMYPDFSKISHSQVWIDAGTQIFFSYAIALGTMTALGSYNDFNNNFYKQLFFVCCMNSGTSIFAGFAIFSVLGFMAYQQNLPITEVASAGPGLAFIAYPKAVSEMPLPYIWAVSFFVMILLLGTGSQFVAMEGFVTAVVDMFPKYLRKGKRRELFIFFTCLISFILGLSMVTRGGMYVFQLFDYYGASGGALLWMCFFESIAIGWFYSCEKFSENIQEMIGYRINRWFLWCWKYITPLVTLGIFVFSIVDMVPPKYKGIEYPSWAICFGMFLAMVSMIQIPLYMIYRIFFSIKEEEKHLTFMQRLKASIKPEVDPQ